MSKILTPYLGTFSRVKTQTTNDASPEAIRALAATKTRGITAVNAGSGVAALGVAGATWTIDELIGATLLWIQGLNGGNSDNPGHAIIEDNSATVLSGLTKPSGAAFANNFYQATAANNTKGAYIEACGLRVDVARRIHLTAEFTGGANPTCDIVLWCYDFARGLWLQFALVGVTATMIGGVFSYDFDSPRERTEIYAQVINDLGTPTSLLVRMEVL